MSLRCSFHWLPLPGAALNHCSAFVQSCTSPVGGRRARAQEGQTERGWVGVVRQMGVCEGVGCLIVAVGRYELIISFASEVPCESASAE